MIRHIIVLFFLTGFLLSHTACNNNDNVIPVKKEDPPKKEEEEPAEDIKDDSPLLPVFIKRTYVLNADPFHNNIDSITFEYDSYNRVIRKSVTISKIYHDSKKEVISNQSITNIVYNDDQTISTTDSIYYLLDENEYRPGEFKYVNIRTYRKEGSIVHIDLNENLKESIILKDNKAVELNKVNIHPYHENPVYFSTGVFEYDDKGNMNKCLKTSDTTFEEKYEYDNHNGIYKHLDMPQWLIVDILGSEHLHNNRAKFYAVFSGKANLYSFCEYTYNSNGYPIEINDRPAPDIDGYWGSKSTIRYMPAHPALVVN